MNHDALLRWLLAASIVGAGVTTSATAQYVCDELQKLVASDGQADDEFGVFVSMSGDVAIVGAWADDDNGVESGSAYVYRYDGATWTEEQKLIASDGAAWDYFGYSVSICGDLAAVGSKYGDASGSAYVFRYGRDSWIQEQKLLASDGAAQDLFGHAVSISGGLVIVGAFGDDDNGSSSGSAYVFDLSSCGCPGDTNVDQVVDAADLASVIVGWGGSGPSDVNLDGIVDVQDLVLVITNWGPCE